MTEQCNDDPEGEGQQAQQVSPPALDRLSWQPAPPTPTCIYLTGQDWLAAREAGEWSALDSTAPKLIVFLLERKAVRPSIVDVPPAIITLDYPRCST